MTPGKTGFRRTEQRNKVLFSEIFFQGTIQEKIRQKRSLLKSEKIIAGFNHDDAHR